MMAQSQLLSEEEYYYKTDNLIRSSCHVLQTVFRHRWMQLTGTEWSSLSVQTFIKGIGKQLYNNSRPAQKKIIQKGFLEEWDISILSKILLLLKSEKLDLVSKQEASAIHNLANLRNKIAHNALKKVTLDEYKTFENAFKENLTFLGLHEDEITKLVTHAGITSAVSALEQANNFQSKGDESHAQARYKEAIEFYNEALTVPSLLPLNQGRIYEKRAASYLALAKNGNGESGYLDQAKKDIEIALELNESSWKAHEVMAFVCKEKSDLKVAIQHFNRALAISPGQTEVKKALDACKLLAGIIDRQEHLDPQMMPMNLSERVKHFTDETGTPMTEEMFLKLGSMNVIKGQDHVAKAHQYRMGWNVRQDATEAARYYAKAAQVGSAEGAYNLAMLHKDGNGVRQDIPYALELLRKAANMPPIIQVGGQKLKDVGVYSAQHSLGLMYHEGVGVSQSSSEAAFWYKKAAENGCGNGANNLAILYSTGRGVKQNEKMAEKYWKLAVERKNPNAAVALYHYYNRRMEPRLARVMFETAIELGDQRISSIRTEVNQQLNQLEQRRKELEGPLLEFEQDNSLSTRGLTFWERRDRMLKMSSPEMKSLMEVMGELNITGTGSNNPITKWAGMAGNIDRREIMQKSACGSETASNIMKTMIGNYRFVELWGGGPPFSDSQFKSIIGTLYDCYCLESHIFRLPQDIHTDLLSFLDRALTLHGSKPSELDKKIRYCYVIATAAMSNIDYCVEVAKEGMKRYPDVVHFYQAVSDEYGLLQKYRQGLEVVRQGLRRFPGSINLLYSKAVHLRLSEEGSPEQVREAYCEFIENAPRDHRKLPEAHYSVATSHINPATVRRLKSNEAEWKLLLEKVKYHYDLGEAAEKIQLSCYLPYSSSAKLIVELMIKETGGTLNDHCKQPSKHEPSKPEQTASVKLHLQDPRRIETIKRHRENLQTFKDIKPGLTRIGATAPPKFNPKLPKRLSELTGITLQEMPPIKDAVYENRILNLTIIDEPILGYPSVHLIAEDENGEATRLYVYNVPQNQETHQTLGFGCRLSIINPYMRIAQDLTCGIRVDDPKCIIYMDGVENMCRYCGEENAPHKCAKCKFAQYCSRPCQVSDWKILNHKLICCARIA